MRFLRAVMAVSAASYYCLGATPVDPCFRLCLLPLSNVHCDAEVTVDCQDNMCRNIYKVPLISSSTTTTSFVPPDGSYLIYGSGTQPEIFQSIGCDEAVGIFDQLSHSSTVGTRPKRSRTEGDDNFVPEDHHRNLRARTGDNDSETDDDEVNMPSRQANSMGELFTAVGRDIMQAAPVENAIEADDNSNQGRNMDEGSLHEGLVTPPPGSYEYRRSYTMFHGELPDSENTVVALSNEEEEPIDDFMSEETASVTSVVNETSDTEIPELTFERRDDYEPNSADILDSSWSMDSELHAIGDQLSELRYVLLNSIVPVLSRFPLIDQTETNKSTEIIRNLYEGIMRGLEENHKQSLGALTRLEVQRMKFLTLWVKSVMFVSNIYLLSPKEHLQKFVFENVELVFAIDTMLRQKLLAINSDAYKLLSKMRKINENFVNHSTDEIGNKLIEIEKGIESSPKHNSMVCTVCNSLLVATDMEDHHHDEQCPGDHSDLSSPFITRFGDYIVEGIRAARKDSLNRSGMLKAHVEDYMKIVLYTFQLTESLLEKVWNDKVLENRYLKLRSSLEHVCEHHASIMLGSLFPASKDVAAITVIFKKLSQETRESIDVLGRLCVEQVAPNIREMLRTNTETVVTLSIPEQERVGVVTIKQDLPEIFLTSVFAQMEPLTRIDFYTRDHMRVRFDGELPVGIGPMLQTVGHFLDEVLNEKLNMFVSTSGVHKLFYKPNPDLATAEMETQCETVGKAVGLALAHKVQINLRLSPAAIALLMNPDFGKTSFDNKKIVELFKIQDEQNYKAFFESKDLAWTKGTEFPITITRTVESDADYDDYKIEVARMQTVESIRPCILAMLRGIYQVLPYSYLAYNTLKENMAAISGYGADYAIDVADLKESASYKIYLGASVESILAEFGEDEPTTIDNNVDTNQSVQFLWHILEKEFTNKQRQDFIYFVSGSRYPPHGGFTGPNKDKKWLSVHVTPYLSVKHQTSDGNEFTKLSRRKPPTAAICFTKIIIGVYSTMEELKGHLVEAIAVKDMHNL